MIRLLLSLTFAALLLGNPNPSKAELEKKFQMVLNGEAEQDFKLGLALGAGAAKGFAHVGVLRALEEYGLRIDMIAGSSMGSIIGGGYAAGLSVDQLADVALESDWLDVIQLIDPVFPARGFIDGVKITKFLDDLFGSRNIEDLPIPFAATTVDILNGDLYIINRGSLARAARASSSIPVVFNPMAQGDLVLVDGGMIDPVPIDVVRSLGAEYIIAVNVLAFSDEDLQDKGFQYLDANDLVASRSVWTIPKRNEAWYSAGKPNLVEIAHETVILAMALIAANEIEIQQPNLLIDINTGLAAWNFLEGEIAIEKGYSETKRVLGAKLKP